MSVVSIKRLSLPPFDVREITRYAGGGKETEKLISDALSELDEATISDRVCMCEYPVAFPDSETVDFVFSKVKSLSLVKLLSGCESAIIFCATAGIGIDRLISKYSAVSPAKALIFQSIGAERIEALCDSFCEQLKKERATDEYITPRFSPGYGDLPLEFQKEIFKVLNPEKHLGVFLCESFVMSPSKSVTAIIGIKKGDKNK